MGFKMAKWRLMVDNKQFKTVYSYDVVIAVNHDYMINGYWRLIVGVDYYVTIIITIIVNENCSWLSTMANGGKWLIDTTKQNDHSHYDG